MHGGEFSIVARPDDSADKSSHAKRRRQEWRRGTQECVRHANRLSLPARNTCQLCIAPFHWCWPSAWDPRTSRSGYTLPRSLPRSTRAHRIDGRVSRLAEGLAWAFGRTGFGMPVVVRRPDQAGQREKADENLGYVEAMHTNLRLYYSSRRKTAYPGGK